ncbi:MAG: hypothetical protein KDC85_21735 [Saprospiraceae bacterium]|nr:hypothetical protein [Saprospiraceae bacterium]
MRVERVSDGFKWFQSVLKDFDMLLANNIKMILISKMAGIFKMEGKLNIMPLTTADGEITKWHQQKMK